MAQAHLLFVVSLLDRSGEHEIILEVDLPAAAQTMRATMRDPYEFAEAAQMLATKKTRAHPSQMGRLPTVFASGAKAKQPMN